MNKKLKITMLSLIGITVFLLLFIKSMFHPLDHDENLYIGGAYLLSKGYIPYIDFPYNHFPNQMIIFAPFIRVFKYKLLAARTINVLFAWAILLTIYYWTKREWKTDNWTEIFALTIVIILLLNPIFIYTSGLSWNHDLSTLTCILGIVTLILGIEKQKTILIFWSGFFISFAICTRISFAPILIAARWAIEKYSNKKIKKETIKNFYYGLLIAALPTIILFLINPKLFIFRTLSIAKLNALYIKSLGYKKAMTLSGKISYFMSDILYKNKSIFILFIIIITSGLKELFTRRKEKDYWKIKIILAFILAIIPGTISPTPTWPQYFYPLIILSIFLFIQITKEENSYIKGIYLAIIIFFSLSNISAYKSIKKIKDIDNYAPIKVHRLGNKLKHNITPKEKVLTLCPIYPIEANLDIFPEFGDGPFAWRFSFFVDDSLIRELNIVAPTNIDKFFKREKPKYGLFGCEPFFLEKPLIDTFLRQKYKYKILFLRELKR